MRRQTMHSHCRSTYILKQARAFSIEKKPIAGGGCKYRYYVDCPGRGRRPVDSAAVAVVVISRRHWARYPKNDVLHDQ